MRKLILLVYGATVLLGAMSSAASAQPGGNSEAAHACQQGGFMSLVGTNGGFTNVGKCVSYAAHGGTFVTPMAGQFLIPAGQTATLSETVLSACNTLTYGYQSSSVFTAIGDKAYGCRTVSQADATIGPFPTAVIVSIVLIDNTCSSATFDSTGNHARVTGANPYDVDISDAGFFCEAGEGVPRPPGTSGNLSTTLTIAPLAS